MHFPSGKKRLWLCRNYESFQPAVFSLQRWQYHIPPCVSYACLMKVSSLKFVYSRLADSRKSTLTQKALNVACAEHTCRYTEGVIWDYYPRVIYSVQDRRQLLCYKLSVDLFSVHNRIWFHRNLILTRLRTEISILYRGLVTRGKG